MDNAALSMELSCVGRDGRHEEGEEQRRATKTLSKVRMLRGCAGHVGRVSASAGSAVGTRGSLVESMAKAVFGGGV